VYCVQRRKNFNENNTVRRYRAGSKNLSGDDLCVDFRLLICFERRESGVHFIQENTQSPPIHWTTVTLKYNNKFRLAQAQSFYLINVFKELSSNYHTTKITVLSYHSLSSVLLCCRLCSSAHEQYRNIAVLNKISFTSAEGKRQLGYYFGQLDCWNIYINGFWGNFVEGLAMARVGTG